MIRDLGTAVKYPDMSVVEYELCFRRTDQLVKSKEA
jgi:hypothetical protein